MNKLLSATPEFGNQGTGGHYQDIIRAQIIIIKLHQDQPTTDWLMLTNLNQIISVHNNVAENLMNCSSKCIHFLTAISYRVSLFFNMIIDSFGPNKNWWGFPYINSQFHFFWRLIPVGVDILVLCILRIHNYGGLSSGWWCWWWWPTKKKLTLLIKIYCTNLLWASQKEKMNIPTTPLPPVLGVVDCGVDLGFLIWADLMV